VLYYKVFLKLSFNLHKTSAIVYFVLKEKEKVKEKLELEGQDPVIRFVEVCM